MKKIVLGLLSTLTVVVLLFGYHTSTSGALSSASPPAVFSRTRDVTGAAATQAPAVAPSDAPSAPPSSSATPSGGASAPSSPVSPSSPSPSSTPAGASGTVTGDVAQTEWGPVQVELTISGGQIAKVSVLEYPDGNPRDAEINDYALPILVQETLDAQNAQIDMVSGATVTSGGYLTSLQSALDQAHL